MMSEITKQFIVNLNGIRGCNEPNLKLYLTSLCLFKLDQWDKRNENDDERR